MNNSSLSGSHGFPQDGSDYAVDPSLLNDSAWVLPPDQYAHHDNFTPHQSFQQYSSNAPSYGGYTLPQGSSYPTPSYTTAYSPQYQHSDHLDHFPLSQFGLPPSQGPSVNQPSYTAGHSTFPYTTFGQETATISPHALQKTDLNISQPQRALKSNEAPRIVDSNSTFSQTWDHNVARQYQQQNAANSIGLYNQHGPSGSDLVQYPSLSAGFPPSSGQAPGYQSQGIDATKTPALRKAKSTTRQSSLRVTHPDLLSATENNPTRRLSYAPFLVIDEEPVDLQVVGKVKLSTYKPLKDKNGRPLVPGLENINTSTTPSVTSIKKARGRPPKTAASAIKTKVSTLGSDQSQVKDAKSRLIAETKPVDSPSPSEVTSSSEEESTSEGESEEEEDDEMAVEQMSDVREETRPSDIVAAAAWDATGIVWAPRHRLAYREEIVKAAPEFEKFIIKLRDDLKAASADLAAAEVEKRSGDIKRLRDARAKQSSIIVSAIQSAIKNGHREILEHLGKSPKLVVGLVGILMDCIKAKDYDGELPKMTLILLSRFHYLTDELLQKTKFDSVEKRFILNANSEIKGYINTIRANTPEGKERAKKANEQILKADKQKPQEPVKPRKVEELEKPASTTSSLKRSIDHDTNSGHPSKKVASDATAVGQGPKAATVKPRTTNIFASLKRPSLKSSIAAKNAPSATTAKKPEPKQEPKSEPKSEPKREPTSKPQSSLAAILASIEQPREVPKQPEEPPRPPETPQEKAKRERKESRRHLRVRWKDGAALVEVKLFRHEQAEDEGRQDNMLRDARDDRSEGMMLKQRVLDTLEDDDDDSAAEVEYRPYPDLMSIDFNGMDPEMLEKNFATRGGQRQVNSPQQQVQDRREAMELMVIYTDPKDIPASPKEPPSASYDRGEPERDFGRPSAMWLVQRIEEIRLYGHANARSIFARRLEEQKYKQNSHSTPFGAKSDTAPDITSILNAMKGLAPSQQTTANPSAYQPSILTQPTSRDTGISSSNSSKMDPAALANLERVAAYLKGKPYPPTEPPEWMTEKGKAMWWEGYNRDKAAAGRKIAEARAAQMQAAQVQKPLVSSVQAQPQMATPQMQYPQVSSYSAPQPPSMTPGVSPPYDTSQLQNILAGLSAPQGNSQTNTAPPQLQNILAGLTVGQNNITPLQQQQAWLNAWQAANAGNNSSQAYPTQNQQPRWDGGWAASNSDISRSAYNDNSRSTYDSNQDNSRNRGRDGGYSSEERPRNATAREYKGPKKPCKFWQEGKCAKGANCTFLHE